MKKYGKIIFVLLIFTLTLSICSCTVFRDIARVPQFSQELMSISNISKPEEAIAKAEELLHPLSTLTKDVALEKAKAQIEQLGVDVESLNYTNYSIGNISDLELKFNDAALGGNVYETKIAVTIDSFSFTVNITILSDEADIGIYDFQISR